MDKEQIKKELIEYLAEADRKAPSKDRIKGSDINKNNSASNSSGDIKFSAVTKLALQNKVNQHNKAMKKQGKPESTMATYGQLAAVYRRGSGAYSVSHRPGVSRGAWAMARVNAFLYLLKNGRPENSKYVTDNDLLPEKHPRKSNSKAKESLQEAENKYNPPKGAQSAAKRALEWIAQGKAGSGFTDVGRARAAQLARGGAVSEAVAKKMKSYFARHAVDKKATGFNSGEDGYPSPGRVAWDAWGGDAAASWSAKLTFK